MTGEAATAEYLLGMSDQTKGSVEAVCAAPDHGFSKTALESVNLIAGVGVEGDAHAGKTVKHEVRQSTDPESPNLRQVHLLGAELLDELNAAGFELTPGMIGENILTRGLELGALPRGTRLHLGAGVVVELTGLRDPCGKLDRLRPGLREAVLGEDGDGALLRKAGVMSVVLEGGELKAGDEIAVELPGEPYKALEPV